MMLLTVQQLREKASVRWAKQQGYAVKYPKDWKRTNKPHITVKTGR